jgi:hypothetical protein
MASAGQDYFSAQRNGPVASQARGNLLLLEQKPILLAGFYVRCFHSFFTLCGFILNFLPVAEGAKAFFGDIGVMDKQVLTAIIRGNESEPLLLVEPLYCTAAHIDLLGPPADHIAKPLVIPSCPRPEGTRHGLVPLRKIPEKGGLCQTGNCFCAKNSIFPDMKYFDGEMAQYIVVKKLNHSQGQCAWNDTFS